MGFGSERLTQILAVLTLLLITLSFCGSSLPSYAFSAVPSHHFLSSSSVSNSSFSPNAVSSFPIQILSGTQIDGYFGYSVSASGNLAIVGAPSQAASGIGQAGDAYVYNASTGALIQSLASPNPQIDGYFGESVAMSGDLAIVGAPYETAGHAYVFNVSSGKLILTLTSPNAQSDGFFGWSVAVSGNLAIVGAPYENASGTQIELAGNAYVFNAESGKLIQILTSPNAVYEGGFGISVSMSGKLAIVGVDAYESASVQNQNKAYLFNPETGKLIRILSSPNSQSGGQFGLSVAVSGNLAIVGAPDENASGTQIKYAGNAYVFNDSTGKLIQTLTSPNAQGSGWFGTSVAISGSLAVVGADGETVDGNVGAGNAYMFNADTGKLIRILTSPNPQVEGNFGSSVGVSGDLAIVGAYSETSFASDYNDAGNAYAFNTSALILILRPSTHEEPYFGWSVAMSSKLAIVGAYGDYGNASVFNSSTGALISTLNSPNPQIDGYFGRSVAMSGDLAIVGAPYETADGQTGAGHAYVFNVSTGKLILTLTSPNAQSDGNFGWSVGISGSLAIVGAPVETSGGNSVAGNAYVFSTTTGKLLENLTSPNAQSFGYFGSSVSISGKLAIVGAYGETVLGVSYAGNAYLFNSNTGQLIHTLTSPEPGGGFFGYSVAVSGKLAIVGAPDETVGSYADAGYSFVFNTTTGAWITILDSPNAQNYGYFGWSVGISGDLVIVGAPFETAGGIGQAGNAYVFKASTGSLIPTLSDPDVQSAGYYGYSVSISGKLAIVGAPFQNNEAGNAYEFQT